MKDKYTKIFDIIEFLYDKSLNGMKGFKSAYEIGNKYIIKYDDIESAMEHMIINQLKKSISTGIVSGIEGIVFPISLPMNLLGTLYIQIRTISVIAYMRGYDLYHEQIKYMVYLCLCGKKAYKITENTVSTNYSNEIIEQIKKEIIVQLVTNFNISTVETIVDMIPVAGSVIAATLNLRSSKEVIEVSKNIFIKK